MELNEEMQMKQRWLNNRTQLLAKYAHEAPSKRTKKLVGSFLLRIKPDYPHKAYTSVLAKRGLGTYFGEGTNPAIPLQMPSVQQEPVKAKGQAEGSK